MSINATALLIKDELVGFAKSKVMLVLWVLIPAIALLAFFALKGKINVGGKDGMPAMSAQVFVSTIISSLGGTVGAFMVAVDIVNEKNRNVYTLLVVRPIRREVIIWAKFLAVFLCVVATGVIAMTVGLLVDVIRGVTTLNGTVAYELGKSLVQLTAVIGLATAGGVICGCLANTVLVAVVLVQFGGQNLTIIPLLPGYLGVLPGAYWIIMTISLVLTVLVVFGATQLFKRAQL